MPNIRPFKALLVPGGFTEYAGTRYPELDTYTSDTESRLYIYRMKRGLHVQTGVVACVDIRDYDKGLVKCHELVRPEKIHIQLDQIKVSNSNIEPILLAYDSKDESIPYIEEYADTHTPDYDFDDTETPVVRHQLWCIEDSDLIKKLEDYFADTDYFYICDGHHRIAASWEYYKEKAAEGCDEFAECRFFMASIFPSKEMLILDYNRTVEDLMGLSKTAFLAKLNMAGFIITELSDEPIHPNHGEYAMVLDNVWYRLSNQGEVNTENPVARLDVSVLQDLVLDEILGIEDPKNDDRLGFIRGTRGLKALQEATMDDMGVAFAIAPVSMKEILDVANANMTMPPKSTCFEPKPISGLIIHKLTD